MLRYHGERGQMWEEITFGQGVEVVLTLHPIDYKYNLLPNLKESRTGKTRI